MYTLNGNTFYSENIKEIYDIPEVILFHRVLKKKKYEMALSNTKEFCNMDTTLRGHWKGQSFKF